MRSVRPRRLAALLLAGALAAGLAACAPERMPVPTASPSPTLSVLPTPVEKVKSFFDKDKHSIDDPLSIWVINDKLRPLDPIDYAPPDMVRAPVRHVAAPLMRPAAAEAVTRMFAAAEQEGAGAMQIQNSYRSYQTQVSIHQSLIRKYGKEVAQTRSARPGYSEHQTGWTADVISYPGVCNIQQCFGTTPQGEWLAANAWRFGFVIRYPQGKQHITGYIYEPWHVRYVGTELATEMHETGVETLEEFFGLPPAPDYPD